jgi:hypothetical protein
MLVRYLDKRPQRLTAEQIETARGQVAQALIDERARPARPRKHLVL